MLCLIQINCLLLESEPLPRLYLFGHVYRHILNEPRESSLHHPEAPENIKKQLKT